jgi:hypothetical protein
VGSTGLSGTALLISAGARGSEPRLRVDASQRSLRGVGSEAQEGEPRRSGRYHGWRSVAESALVDAPEGPVGFVASHGASPTGFLAGRPVEALEFRQSVLSRPEVVGGDPGPVAALVIEAALHSGADHSTLLGAARDVLHPNGVLVLNTNRGDSRTNSGGTDPQRCSTSVEKISASLFLAGFERPRFYRRKTGVVILAHKSQQDPPGYRRQKLTIVLPVYNEKATFSKTMELLLAKEIPGLDMEIIIVESKSTDGTRDDVVQYAADERVQAIFEDRPQGKGHAVRRGLRAATGDFVLIQDADLEYDIDDYDQLLAPLRSGEVGFVLGMRTTKDGHWGVRQFGQNTIMSHIMNVGHVVFLALFNLVYGQRLRDPFTMYKVFRRDCIEGLVFECDRFDFDWELTGKLIRAGYHPLELPVNYHSRSFHEGKKVRVLRDPMSWIRACFRYRFQSLYSYDG